jgi:hypothetical protein
MMIRARLPCTGIRNRVNLVKVLTYKELKLKEAQSRMRAIRKAKSSRKAAQEIQQRFSAVGDASKWKITNLPQVAEAMAKWI